MYVHVREGGIGAEDSENERERERERAKGLSIAYLGIQLLPGGVTERKEVADAGTNTIGIKVQDRVRRLRIIQDGSLRIGVDTVGRGVGINHFEKVKRVER